MKKTALLLVLLLITIIQGFSQVSGVEPVSSGQIISIKPGTIVTLRASADDGSSFQWFKNNSPIPGAMQNRYRTSEPGQYSVASTSSTCASMMSDPIQIVILPSIAFKADVQLEKVSETRSRFVGDVIDYTIKARNHGSDNATSLIVTDSLPAELHFIEYLPTATGTIRYEALARAVIWEIPELKVGEESSLKIRARALKAGEIENRAAVTAFESDPDLSNNSSKAVTQIHGLKVPNVFSPNGDGVNDRFRIPGLTLYRENEFTVINRWGSHVFEKKQYQDEWTGEGLHEGTYFYVLRIKSENEKWQVLKGYITLLRSK